MPAVISRSTPRNFDIVVVGGGHAGVEAAHAAARMGAATALITMDPAKIALMPCNPAIGGLAKGQLTREIDALGGVMAKAIDATGIQFRTLNTAKGPAVHAPRAQADKRAYLQWMSKYLANLENLEIVSGMGAEILISDSAVSGVALGDGTRIGAKALILCSGTFLDGLIHIGLRSFPAGRAGEERATGLGGSLVALGLETGRLKTGTPARLDRRSIDWDKLEPQHGDDPPVPFSFETNSIEVEQVPCHITYTNEKTHEIIRSGLDRSPMFTGVIEGVGPRYCPSIEDKVTRFADRDAHQIFLEPEGRNALEVYPNGISTSLPEDIQRAFIQTIPGLENARILRLGYAIEYTYCLPHQLNPTYETKLVPGLYLAGQINATSGYEEAGAQGLMAGISAALKIQGEEPLVLGRHEAYIGVLTDDLITKDHREPYRMFTSRAEYRLALRHDTADLRLTGYGRRAGLIGDDRWDRFQRKCDAIADEISRLENVRPEQDALVSTFEPKGLNPPENRPLASEILARPEFSWDALGDLGVGNGDLDSEVARQVYLHFRYAGYLRKEAAQVERFRGLEEKRIPDGFDFQSINGLRREARDKLARFKPTSLGQASRIAGVTPADISVLMVALKASGV